jgi:hypothetical protein
MTFTQLNPRFRALVNNLICGIRGLQVAAKARLVAFGCCHTKDLFVLNE